MVRSILKWLVLVPIACILIAFAVANRRSIGISLDPFSSTAPEQLTIHVPLFLVMLIILIAGVIVGGIAAWLRQRKWRRAARQLEMELRAARADAEAWKRRAAVHSPTPGSLPYRPPSAA